ncbi:MAG: hypothetical protein ACOYIK_10205 [Coriobacteriales bacterium]
MNSKLAEMVKEYVKQFGEGISYGYNEKPEEELMDLISKAMETGVPLPQISNEFDEKK